MVEPKDPSAPTADTESRVSPEILHEIFSHVREQQGPRALLPSLRVCRFWKDIAYRALYANVVLTNDNIEPFIDCVLHHQDSLIAVRSLTLRIEAYLHAEFIEDDDVREQYRKNGLPQTQALENQLERLTNLILPRLSGLSTFSIFVSVARSNEQRAPEDHFGFRIDNKVLGSLLRALPQSCVNLELDTDMADWSPDDKPHHVCSDLWSLLPRLRHVKLRMHSLCGRMLCMDPTDPSDRRNQPDISHIEDLDGQHVVKSDRLRTLSICTSSRNGAGSSFVDCSYLQHNLDLGVHEPWPYGFASGICRPQALSANLAAAYKAGRFPHARLLEISQECFEFPPPKRRNPQARDRAAIYSHVVLLRDCINDITLPQPMRLIENGYTLALYDKSDTCVIGKPDDLIRHAEDTIWEETAYGARMPCAEDAVFRDVQFQSRPGFMSRAEWCQQSKFVMMGWKTEEDQGQKIRRVVPLPGADADFSISKMPMWEGTQLRGGIVYWSG